MAFLFKRTKSPYWFAGFRDNSGARRNRSTKVPHGGTPKERAENRKKALHVAGEFESTSKGLKTSLALRRSMAELHEQATGEKVLLLTVRECSTNWLNSKRGTVDDSSLPTYASHMNSFLEALGEKSDWEIYRISKKDIEAFRNLTGERVAVKTANNTLKTVRMFFRSMKEEALITDLPTEFVKGLAKDEDKEPVKKETFSPEQVKTVLEHCEDEEWKSLVLWAYSTGQRLGDLARLTWKAVDIGKGTFSFTTKKTHKAMTLPLHKDLWKILKTLPQPIDKNLPIHPKAFAAIPTTGPRKGKASALSNQFGRILVKAGLRVKRPHRALGNGRNGRKELNALTFHSFRKTAATTLAEQGVPRAVAMELIGHDSADIHEAYVRIGEKAMREGIEKIPSVL